MDPVVLGVFVLVYIGMILGGLPGLALDRTGVALLGGIALLATGRISPEEARDAVDVPTIGLLFGLMVISAQFRLGGFYARVTRGMADADLSPRAFLGLLIVVSGFLSALLANDIVCLAVTPVLVEGCLRRGLNPIPYALALACASNIGSAATLIGNPQNMLIGQRLDLSFAVYFLQAIIPTLLGMGALWLLLARKLEPATARTVPDEQVGAPPFDRWQTFKGAAVLSVVVAAFLFAPWPREVAALAGAGLLLTSRRMTTRSVLDLIDWNLLTLFAGLFIVNHALESSGLLDSMLAGLRGWGVDPAQPGWLFGITVALSNLVSNVPATMLLLPVATHELAGPILALASTFAGNLFLVGSIANLIVVDQAALVGVRISWKDHLRVGVPVTLATLAITAVWLVVLAYLP